MSQPYASDVRYSSVAPAPSDGPEKGPVTYTAVGGGTGGPGVENRGGNNVELDGREPYAYSHPVELPGGGVQRYQ